MSNYEIENMNHKDRKKLLKDLRDKLQEIRKKDSTNKIIRNNSRANVRLIGSKSTKSRSNELLNPINNVITSLSEYEEIFKNCHDKRKQKLEKKISKEKIENENEIIETYKVPEQIQNRHKQNTKKNNFERDGIVDDDDENQDIINENTNVNEILIPCGDIHNREDVITEHKFSYINNDKNIPNNKIIEIEQRNNHDIEKNINSFSNDANDKIEYNDFEKAPFEKINENKSHKYDKSNSFDEITKKEINEKVEHKNFQNNTTDLQRELKHDYKYNDNEINENVKEHIKIYKGSNIHENEMVEPIDKVPTTSIKYGVKPDFKDDGSEMNVNGEEHFKTIKESRYNIYGKEMVDPIHKDVTSIDDQHDLEPGEEYLKGIESIAKKTTINAEHDVEHGEETTINAEYDVEPGEEYLKGIESIAKKTTINAEHGEDHLKTRHSNTINNNTKSAELLENFSRILEDTFNDVYDNLEEFLNSQ